MAGNLVGVRGFEPPTPSSRTRCATRLRYTPTPVPEARNARLIDVTSRRGKGLCNLVAGRGQWWRPLAPRAGKTRRERLQPRRQHSMFRPPERAVRRRRGIGASPSGKAADFDSAMRRFESSRPSQAFPGFPLKRGLCRKGGVCGAFARGLSCMRPAKTRIRAYLDAILLRVCAGFFQMSGNMGLAGAKTGSKRPETGFCIFRLVGLLCRCLNSGEQTRNLFPIQDAFEFALVFAWQSEVIRLK